MRLRTLLWLSAFVSALFALGLLLGPDIILKFFGFTATAPEKLLAQLIGAGLVGVAVVSFFAQGMADSQALSMVLISLLIASVVAFVVGLLAMIAKVPPKVGPAWVVVALFLLFGAGFAYFQFFGPRE